MKATNNNNIVDLIIPEDELLSFQAPSLDKIRSAYGKSYNEYVDDPLEHIERLFPKPSPRNRKINKEQDDPGFSIDNDDDPLII